MDDGSNNSDSATTVVEESYQARILAADPEGFYRLGESSSEGGLNDSSPNNNDGLYGEVQPPVTTSPDRGAPGAIQDDSDTAANFDGVPTWATPRLTTRSSKTSWTWAT